MNKEMNKKIYEGIYKGSLKMPYSFKILEYLGKNKDSTMKGLLNTGIAFAHLNNMKQMADNNGWLNITKDGKKQIINLTLKGTLILKTYLKLVKELPKGD